VTISDVDAFLTLTPEAYDVVRDALAGEESAESLALWIEVVGVRGTGYAYDLFFQDREPADEDVARFTQDDLTVVVPTKSVDRLRGARLEFATDDGGGLVLVNPNAPSAEEINPGVPAEVLALGLTGGLALRALDILERTINPQIASHGGRADLVALSDEEKIAYVRLSGGCQGCAMSRMTLSQGIETTLKSELPELVSVVDVTDHASGVSPFYE
jgi:Fe/S biogenesis protein NfuA